MEPITTAAAIQTALGCVPQRSQAKTTSTASIETIPSPTTARFAPIFGASRHAARWTPR